MQVIPEIIHQSWKDHDIPPDYYPPHWIDSWLALNPGWKRRFWTDADNETLVRRWYPQFYDFYVSLAPPIKKADFARFLYMHRFGGVYVDLDFVCLKPLAGLLNGHHIVLGRLSPDNDYYQIANAFMASVPNERFWLDAATEAMRAPPSEQGIDALAGSLRLQWAYYRYEPERSAVIGDGRIFPFDWIHFTDWNSGHYYRADRWELAKQLKDASIEEMAKGLPEAYCVTFWTHNW